MERQCTTCEEASLADNLCDLGFPPLPEEPGAEAMDAAYAKWASDGFPIPGPDAQSLADPTETS